MNTTLRRLALGIASAGLLTIYGCGGGGASSASGSSSSSLSGMAATGAAFTDATVTVTDSRGTTVGTGTVGTDGTYNITLTSGAVAPFVLTATRTSADGAVQSLVSVVPTALTGAATVNITPVTSLIASRLSSSGDPLKLASEMVAGTSTISATTVAAKVAEVQTILGPILTATGTTGNNPLTGSFAADGTGYDRLLDSIKVTITPANASASNIEVAIKQQLTEGTAPTAIQFTSATAAASVPAIPAVNSATLIASGTSALIAQHLTQLNTCFALPTATRVNNPNPSGGAVATASSTNITATACRDAFIQDGGGAILFKTSGNVINAKSGKPFRGIFFDGGTGVVFSQGTYEFTRGNGDIVVSYKSKTSAGNETFETFALRKDVDGKLKQIGNQYDYPGGVSAYHQNRQFITLGQSAFNYYSTGYNLGVDDVTGGAGVGGSIFDHVTVTTPRGNTLTLVPKTGYSYLTLVTGAYPLGSGTSFVRLRSEYIDAGNATDPAIKDTAALFFADRTVFTNTYIATIPAQSVWKFEYYLAGAPGVVAATQYYKTRARALTIPELQTKGMATLASADIATIQTNANGAGVPPAGQLPIGNATSVPINYLVAAGALPPTSLTIWGGYSNAGTPASFTDSATVGSAVRTGSVLCTSTGGGDTHCSAGAYAASAALNGLHLWARDPQGLEFASFYAMYSL